MANPFYTIGHGTRSLQDFVELLKEVGVTLVVDVRTVPRSRTNPQYNGDALPDSLAPSALIMSTWLRSADCAAVRATCRAT